MNIINRMRSSELDVLSWCGKAILYFAVIVIPSLMLYKEQLIPESMKVYMYKDDVYYESLYSYWKSIGLLITLIAIVVLFTYIFISKVCRKNLFQRFKYYKLEMASILVMGMLAIFSAIASEYKDVVWMGFVSKSEGTIQWLAYFALSILVLLIIRKRCEVDSLVKMLFYTSILILTHATITYFYSDFYNVKFINELITIGSERFEAIYSGASLFTASLYNPNYMGSYLAMLIPLFMFYDLEILGGYKWNIYQAWLWFGLFASNSSAGFVGTLGAIVFILIASRLKVVMGNEKKYLLLLITIPILYFGVAEYSGRSGLIQQEANQLERVLSESNKNEFNLKELTIGNDRITIDFTTKELNFVYEGVNIKFMDGNEKPIDYEYDSESGEITFVDPDYEGLIIVNANNSAAAFSFGELKFYLGNDDGKPYISDVYGYRIDNATVEKVLPGYEKFASGRGYIWSRSIPLLKDSTLIGYGADTYPLVFPQHDIVGKILGGQRVSTFIDKPHNMYLMIGLNFGCVALLIYIIMLGKSFIEGTKVIWLSKANLMVTGLFGSFLGHNIAAFFNDSTLSVSTVYFVILGLLIVAIDLANKGEGGAI